MEGAAESTERNDPYGLNRFLEAQEGVVTQALAELREGHKRSHWMWYIFPQLQGLGHSPTTQYYAIKSIEEARAYLAHLVLGERLRTCAQALLEVKGRSVTEILGYPDNLKLRSSMTLFAALVDDPQSVFNRVLDVYYDGEEDARTLDLLRRL